ncbi:MAG: proprotein convertase P-domain-containing protein [Candidatus Solibacter sp.]|nr:proprotein convertase P-domain-containing protein [Candidatus Solibacter sp.]
MTRFNAKCALPLLLWVTSATAQTTPVTVAYSYTGFPVYIPIQNANVFSFATVTVPDALKVTKVTAKVLVEYPAVGDLNLYLYSPDGTRVKLLERNCSALANVDTTFDDAAQSSYSDFCPAEAGRGPFKGNEPLSNFNSADSSIGNWRLMVQNNGSNSRTGWLRGFTLTITGTSQMTPVLRPEFVLNSASARNGAIAPGENITILGTGLGPVTGLAASGSPWSTTLGGVQVSINGAAIPLSYVSRFRIEGQVPYGVSTTGPATIQVQNGTTTSSLITVGTQATSPSIYVYDQLGIGSAKAFNQDGTLNSSLSPTRRGSIVSVYANGLGAVAPASAAGQGGPSNPLSLATQTVTASIGGVPAVVTFAGLAPGFPGTYQVNILVPLEVPAGTRAIEISNAGNASQGNVTIEVQ